MSRRLFVAGSTGAVGRTLMPLARAAGLEVLPHVRPKHTAPEPGAAVFELSDAERLRSALQGCTTVLQLIGTMRKRFDSGDTYETSDVGTTRSLVEAARQVGVDHFILLSSVGAGRPRGAYLQAKARAEGLVRDSGIPFTIFRPSAFEGAGHKAPPGAVAITRFLGLYTFMPIQVEVLAQALLQVAKTRGPLGAVLEGRSLWEVVAAAQ